MSELGRDLRGVPKPEGRASLMSYRGKKVPKELC